MASIKEAQGLVDQGFPTGWVDRGDGFFTVAGSEVYGVDVVKQLDGKGGWEFIFESTPPVSVEEAIAHPKGVTVRTP